MFKINPQSGVPIYRQLMDQIQRMISGGQLQPGDTLPSVRQISEEHTVNTMTVSKAYSLLEAQGFLLRQRGKAMTVADTQADSKAERLSLITPQVEQLTAAARQLNLSSEDIIQSIRNHMEATDA